MKKINLVIVAIALVLLIVPAHSQVSKVGTVGFKFLDIGVGGRAQAMGEAYAALGTDASAVFWNPAGIANIQGGDLFAGYTKWPADINLYSFALARRMSLPVLGTATLALSGTLLNTGEMNRTTEYDPDGDFSGTFSYEDYALGLTLGKYLTDSVLRYPEDELIQQRLSLWMIQSEEYPSQYQP